MSCTLGQQFQYSNPIDANTIEVEGRVIDVVTPGKHTASVVRITTGVCKKLRKVFDCIRWPRIQTIKIGTYFEVGGRLYRVIDIVNLDCGIGERVGAVEVFPENPMNTPVKQLFNTEKVLDSMFFKS